MANTSMTPDELGKLTQWLDQPLTPGKEKELTTWLASDQENQLKWDRWTEFNSKAKRLQIIPSEVLSQWEALRDDIGIGHSVRKKSKRRSGRKKRPLMRRPVLVAFLSTLVFAAFLLVLYLIRVNSSF